MKRPTRFDSVLVCATVLCLAVCLGSLPAGAADTDLPVELRWALGAVEDGSTDPTPIRKDTALDSGTRLKFLVEPISSGSVYLLLLDSRDDIHVLFRQAEGFAGDRAYVPEGNRWFEIDDQAGRETFFLLASAEPMADLDRLITEHEAAAAEERRTISGAIVAEVRRLHKANRQFARSVEKPVMIGGRTRSTSDPESAIDQLAVEISADRFYSKTITIDH